jgi:type II secretory pathway component GspD/PulD (secretin)
MSNFANLVSDYLSEVNQYEDIFNALAQAMKIIMEPTGDNARDNLNAANAVAGTLMTFGWDIEGTNKEQIIVDVTERIISLLRRYLDEEDPSERTENIIRGIIDNLNNYIENNGAAAAAGGRRRKSRRYKRSRKSKKSKKTRKTRK